MQQSFLIRLTVAVAAICLAVLIGPAPADDAKSADGWVPLFNGKDLTGWKIHPNPNPGSIKKVIEVKAGDTVDKLAKRMAVADRHVERFRVLNGLGDKDRVRPGDYMKIVVE